MLTSLIAFSQTDSLQNFSKWKPSYLRIGYDVSRTVSSITSPRDFTQEVSAEIDFHSLFLVAEVGFASNEKPTPGYDAQGIYYRVGIDANLIPYDKLRSAILFSVRYAGANFQQSLATTINDSFGERAISVNEKNLRSSWLEAGLGMKVQVMQNLFIGYSFRLRFANRLNGHSQLLPAEVPGFGRTFNDGREKRGLGVGFHYGFFWRIPFWDKPVPVKKRKIPKVLPPKNPQENPETIN